MISSTENALTKLNPSVILGTYTFVTKTYLPNQSVKNLFCLELPHIVFG